MKGAVPSSPSLRLSVNDSPPMTVFLEWSFRELNRYFVLIIITFFCTLITVGISVVHSFYVSKYVSLRRLRNNLYYVVALNPVCSLCCFFAMIMPRNLAFLQGCILSYQMVALRVSIDVLFNISGGRRLLSDQLKAGKESIQYKVFPCCCCPCLHEATPSVRNIRKLENVISQTCILRVLLQVADVCVMRETGYTHNWWFICSYFFSFITMMLALYYSCVIARLNRDLGNKFRYNYLFYMVNMSQVIYTLQRTIFCGANYLMKVDGNMKPLVSIVNYDYFEETYYLMFTFSVEITLMSIIITVILRPAVSHIFDSYSFRTNNDEDHAFFENSARPDKESKRRAMELSSAPPQSDPIGPDTVMQTLKDSTEPEKKAKNPAAVEDDGNYENLHPQDEQDLKKVLKKMEKK